MTAIPKTGDKFNYFGNIFEVVDIDGNRIDKILIKKAVLIQCYDEKTEKQL